MHDIWNPWHGCTKKSEGCQHCYMYYLDKTRNRDGSKIFKVESNFNYPLQLNRNKQYKIQSGEQIRVCLNSDFFLEEADEWREEAWNIMKQRPDVLFQLLTKRPERVEKCLPKDWNDGWENVFFSVTTENQKRADERIPILYELPFKHKGIMAAPFIGEVSIKKYLEQNEQIEQVLAGGENYDGARPLHYEWVKKLYDECVKFNRTFCFIETGNVFVKDGKEYYIATKIKQAILAYKSKLQFQGKKIDIKLQKINNSLFEDNNWYQKRYCKNCEMCPSKMICNGCSFCGKCKNMY